MTALLAIAETSRTDPSLLHAHNRTSWTDFHSANLAPSSSDIVSAEFTNEMFSSPTFFALNSPAPANWLSEALDELEDACAQPEEEGYSVVSDRTRDIAGRLLSDLAARVAKAPMVHSTPEGGIAIDFRNPERDAAFLIICEGTGEGVCFYDIGDKRGRARSSDASDLIEDAGWSALARMDLI